MNKKTTALTTEQFKEIITTMKEGFCGCHPNERIATALVLEGNLGLRISDIENCSNQSEIRRPSVCSSAQSPLHLRLLALQNGTDIKPVSVIYHN